ncbi:AAA family ATPase [Sulfurospirillum sp. 1612]|uniref:AAA family ATPase n=1 Tax=Sulfurospirillum sp. 1612 TaxID=3094835 RepID=UPI002F93C19B
MLIEQRQNKIITVIGHKGYGKTALTEALMLMYNKPTIIADPRFQYSTFQNRRLSFQSVGKFRKWIYNTANFKVFYKYKLELIVNAFDDTFDELASIVAQMRSLMFVVDEVDMFLDPRATKKNSLNKIIQYGRHHEIDIISTSRRPANISRNLTSQTDIFYFSRLREPTDKLYIKQAIGAEYVSLVENLDRFSFLEFEDEEHHKIITTSKNDLEILQKG